VPKTSEGFSDISTEDSDFSLSSFFDFFLSEVVFSSVIVSEGEEEEAEEEAEYREIAATRRGEMETIGDETFS
jgi:hypothetical protein